MKFFTLFTISALAVVSNTQEPVFMGDKALVIDYAEGHVTFDTILEKITVTVAKTLYSAKACYIASCLSGCIS